MTDSPSYWNNHYVSGRIPWDLRRPTPVFARLAQSGEYAPGRMIVLGAGRGHDARLFARHGFDVTAVDFALEAARAMEALIDPAYPFRILQQDIFHLPADLAGSFDYVLEYTCFCAISPDQRTAYADVVERLLKPGGHYIALAFPIREGSGGPPYAVSPSELIELLEERSFELLRRETPRDSVPGRKGFEELLLLRKAQQQ